MYFYLGTVQATDSTTTRNQWLKGFGNQDWKYLQGVNHQGLLNPKVKGYIVLLLVKSLEKDLTASDIFQVANLKPISGNNWLFFDVHLPQRQWKSD